MFKAITSSLRTKIVIGALIALFVPIALLVGYNTLNARATLLEDDTASEVSIIQAQAENVSDTLALLESNTQFLASAPATGRYADFLAGAEDSEAQAFAEALYIAYLDQNIAPISDIRIIDNSGQEVLRVDDTEGAPRVVSGADLENKADRPYFINSINLPAGQLYSSGFDLNVTRGTIDVPYVPVIRFAIPLDSTSGERVGVVVMKVLLQPLFEELTPDDEEETLILVDQDGEYVVHPDESLLYGTLLGTGHNFFEDRPVDSRAMSASSTEAGALIQTEEIPDAFQYYANIDLGSNDSYDYHLLMIISKPASVVFEHVNNATITEIAFGLFTLFLSVVATSFLGRSMTAPLIKLANAATAIGQGDVNTEIPEVKSSDEVGQLATAFSKMAQDLKVSYGALEERVAARTADLQTSAEIAAAANQVRDVSDLMSLAVNLIRDRFNFYYVQVYISQGDQAVLREGTGYVGRRLLSRGHHLPLDGRSLVAEAIRSGKPQIVQDTKSNPNFLPNELLPDTRAEITIPLRTKNAVVGVLDIQHSVANVFDENSQRLFQSMADQLAVTFENVKLYETTQRRALEMETVAEVSAAISTSLNLDELLTQVANLTKTRFNRYHTHVYLLDNAGENLVLAAGAGEPGRIMKERGHSIPLNYEQSVVARAARSAEAVIVDDVTATPNFLANPLLPDTRSEMAIPIILGEQVLGVLDIQDNRVSAFNEEDVRIKSALADQIAVAVQNARAFQQVQNAERQVRQSVRSLEDLRFALDEAAIVAVTDVSGKITYVNDKFCEISKYSREELIGQDHRIINSSYHPKEFIRNVWVTIANGNVWQGEFCNRNKFGGIYWVDTTIVPLLNEQGKPAQYIAIRYEITARKEAELQVERRAAEMETVAQVSAATARILDVPDLLHQVSELTKERFGLYHAHIYLLNEEGDQLVLAGGAGEAGRIMVNQGRSIAIDSAQSIVANAARTHQAVIVNNVTDEETFLPNPLLPETKSELAAPMLVGDKLVGVLDVQSNVVNRFTEQDMQINVALADQIAVAVQNARAFEQMQIADVQLRRRAVEMQMVAEVSAAASRNLDVDALLTQVSDLTKERFNRYHAHIYLLDDAHEYLVLAAGAGEAGRIMKENQHRIPLDREQSLVARAARTHQAVIVDDVTSAPDFLANPLLPETRSEMALPMIVGDTVIGVLDIQDNRPNAFDEESVQIKSALAAQIAIAVENARTYEVERIAADTLREADRLKSQFLANMSHELRTPLNSIIGYSEVLLDGVDGDLPEEAVEDVEAIHDSGKHLLALINEILDMAKIDAGQLHLDRRNNDLSKVVHEVLKVGQSLIKDKPLKVEVVEDQPVPEVYADALRVRQILLNLVGNAVKFTEEGTITISYGMYSDHEVYIRVRDTGVGITPENLKVVFERFRQVDGSSTRRAGGTGLGLSITQQLVHLHGGEIYAESEPGIGSTFWFTLPTAETQFTPLESAPVTSNGKR